MSTFSISGSGSHALTSGTTALYLDVTTIAAGSGVGRANPTSRYDVGLIRFSDGTGFWAPVAINGGPQWIGVPFGATTLAYNVFGSGVVSVTEVIGGTSPFAGSIPSLSQLTDVSVSSPSNGQVLEWVASASKWENVTPSGFSGLTTASNVLGSDVNVPTAGTYADGPSVTLGAGTWLVVSQVLSNNSTGGSAWTTQKLWDGTTVFASGERFFNFNTETQTITLVALVAPTTSTTYKTSVAFTANNGKIGHLATNNGAPSSASQIVAIKVA